MKVKITLPWYYICPKCKTKKPIELELEIGNGGLDLAKLIELFLKMKGEKK